MVPYSADVTNVLWYNKQLLADAGVAAADDLGGAARRVRHAERHGHHPDRVRQQGPVGGRQLAVATWPRASSARTPTPRPSAAPASSPRPSGRRRSATSRSWPTTSASTTAPTRSTTTRARSCSSRARPPCTRSGRGWSAGRSTRHPTSTSTTSTCPRCPRARGNQDSVIGVATGYVVNAKSAKIDEATEFMALAQQRGERPGAASRPRSRRSPSPRRRARRSTADRASLSDAAQRGAGDRPAARHRLRPQDGRRAVRGRGRRPRRPADPGGGARRDRREARPLAAPPLPVARACAGGRHPCFATP